MDNARTENSTKPWLSARKAGELIGISEKRIRQLALDGYLEVRGAVGDVVRPVYSRQSCLKLRAKIVKPATQLVS